MICLMMLLELQRNNEQRNIGGLKVSAGTSNIISTTTITMMILLDICCTMWFDSLEPNQVEL